MIKLSGVSALILGASALLFGAYLWIGASAPDSVGFWRDDGIYVSTAQALAQGQGYRHPELPGAPFATKYPILYPALLASVFRWAPDFPRNLPWLLVPGALGGALAVVLGAAYFRRVFRAHPARILVVGALAATSPVLLAYARYTMSELVYAGLAVTALLLLDGPGARTDDRRRARAALFAGGLLAAAAVLTRSVGVTLVAAAVAAPLVRGRAGAAAWVGGAAAIVLVPWYAWHGWAAEANGAMQAHRLLSYDLDYSPLFFSSVGDLLRVIWQNLFRVAMSLAYVQLALPSEFALRAITEGGARLAVFHVLAWGATAAAIMGFVRSTARGLETVHLYALAYAAVVLGWPFSPERLLVPWTPFLLFWIFEGLVAWGQKLPKGLRYAPATAAFALLAIAFGMQGTALVRSTPERFAMPERPAGVDLREMREAERWLRDHSAPGDRVASPWPASMFLATGRLGYGVWPDDAPRSTDYGPDRRLETFYSLPAPSEAGHKLADLYENLLRVYDEAGIDWYVAYDGVADTPLIAGVVRSNPLRFRLQHTTRGREIRIYRLVPAD